jgi:hypothetical protein
MSNTDPQTTIKIEMITFINNFQKVINSSNPSNNLYDPFYVNDSNISEKANNILKLYHIILNGGNVNGTQIKGFLQMKKLILTLLKEPSDNNSVTKNYIESAKNNLN